MTKSVIYECPKGVLTRIMEGSTGWDLHEAWRKNPFSGGTRQNPKGKIPLDHHMNQLHLTWLKYNGEVK